MHVNHSENHWPDPRSAENLSSTTIGRWCQKRLRTAALGGLHCHPGYLIQGDEQAPIPKREIFPARQRHSWRWKWAIKTDCLTQHKLGLSDIDSQG